MSEKPQWEDLKTIEFAETDCPVCCGKSSTHRFEKKIYDVIMNYFICNDCNALYANPRATVASLKNIYASADFFDAGEAGEENLNYFDFISGEKYLRKTARDRLSRIRKWKPQGKLLEVASAAGFFLVESKAAGYDTSGVEISRPMAEWASKKWGVDIVPESIELLDLPPSEYDIIASWGVMTIIQDPVRFIQKIHAALKPGGVWAFNTYYHDGLWPKIVKNRWDILVVNYSQIYSRSLLVDIIEKQGFKLVSRRREQPYTDLIKIADKLAQNLGMRWLPGLLNKLGLGQVIVKIPLPDVKEYIFVKE